MYLASVYRQEKYSQYLLITEIRYNYIKKDHIKFEAENCDYLGSSLYSSESSTT